MNQASALAALFLLTSSFGALGQQAHQPLQSLPRDQVLTGEVTEVLKQASTDIRVFHFTAQPGERIQLIVHGIVDEEDMGIFPRLRLGEDTGSTEIELDPVEVPDDDDEDGDVTTEYRTRLLAGGDYYLHLIFSEPGSYELTLHTVPQGKPREAAIQPGQVRRGTFVVGDPLNNKGKTGFGEWVHAYRFQGTAGEQVEFDLEGDVHLAVQDPSKRTVSLTRTEAGKLRATLASTGSHRLEIHSTAAPNLYSVGFGAEAHSFQPPKETLQKVVYPGQPVKGLWDEVEGAVSAYSLAGRKGQPVTITLSSQDAEPHLLLWQQVRSSPFKLLATDHDSDGRSTARIQAVFPEDDSYVVQLIGDRKSGKAEAPFTLEVSVGEPGSARPPDAPPVEAVPGKGPGFGGYLTAFGGMTQGFFSVGGGLAGVLSYELTPVFALQALAGVDAGLLTGVNAFYFNGLLGPGLRVGSQDQLHGGLTAGPALRVDWLSGPGLFWNTWGFGARLDLVPLPGLVISAQGFLFKSASVLQLGVGFAF